MAKTKKKTTKQTPSIKTESKSKSSQSDSHGKKVFKFGGIQAIQVGAISGLLMVPNRSVAGGPCY